MQEKTIIISGWWYNQLMVEMISQPENPQVKFEFYIDEPVIKNYIKQGYQITYLPEQNIYNDQMYQMNITNEIAKPF